MWRRRERERHGRAELAGTEAVVSGRGRLGSWSWTRSSGRAVGNAIDGGREPKRGLRVELPDGGWAQSQDPFWTGRPFSSHHQKWASG